MADLDAAVGSETDLKTAIADGARALLFAIPQLVSRPREQGRDEADHALAESAERSGRLAEPELTPSERQIIHDVLARQRDSWPAERDYAAPEWGWERATCERLAEMGLLLRSGNGPNGMVEFQVTAAGAAIIGRLPPA